MTRFMNKTLHAYLDYPVALGLIAMPFVLELGTVNPLAFWLSVVTGVAALSCICLSTSWSVLRLWPPRLFWGLLDLKRFTIGFLAPLCCLWSPWITPKTWPLPYNI